MRPLISFVVLLAVTFASLAIADESKPDAAKKPIKLFILAGDENVLENGIVQGRTEGVHSDFFPSAKRQGKVERVKHVNVAVYKGAYSPEADYDTLEPVEKGVVELGEPLKIRVRGKRGRVAFPMTAFPELAMKDGHTTVLRGYFSVKFAGKYLVKPGEGESAFNVTTVEGKEVYRRDVGAGKATMARVELQPRKRYAFKTIFFKKPGHAFLLPLTNKPGTLTTAVAANPKKYGKLVDADGKWIKRDDVIVYDAHPVHNNTRAPGRPLSVGVMGLGGPERTSVMGVDLMLGHRLGEAFQEPVMIVRFGVKHSIWFRRGSRDLSHDFRPPSSGGGVDHDGSWDVIHFNHGIHDTGYRDPKSYMKKDENKYPITVPLDRYEANLRKIVAKLKKTGATLIWARTTPVRDDTVGWKAADIDKYNAAADRVMKENGVIINDLHAESIRQGFPKRADVHSVGNLAPKVTETILAALEKRANPTKPLPRVLMIGDSITGSYWEAVKRNLDGKAYVCKNPANGGHSDFGLASVDDWIKLERYLLNGQSYLELVDGVRHAMKNPEQVFPRYAGQGVELAGLIWFHGDNDGAWDSKAASYEKHLANLIRDLRKEFKAPKLPVVVTSLSSSSGRLTPNQQKVFDAQMAMGNAEKYPEFAGNVISVDTRPMGKPGSPGGRDRFRGNAESYLDIGDAMADAMLKLLDKK